MSIEHWYRVRDENEEANARSCSLCDLYWNSKCNDCPIFLKTNNIYCRQTPYYNYDLYIGKSERKRKRLAQAEIDFLQTCYY
jgi:hypothetical protein